MNGPIAPGQFEGGEHSQLTTLARRRAERLKRLLALPLPVLVLLEIAWCSALLVAAVLEVPLLETALARIMPGASDLLIRIGSIAFVIVYAVLWHAMGHRLADAHLLSMSTTTAGRAGVVSPAFGWIGVGLSVTLSAALIGVAIRRGQSLADTAAQRAADNAALDAMATPTESELDGIRSAAWHAAFWPDFGFTVLVMAMLAALAVWIGYSSPVRHEALSLHAARAGAEWANRRADTLAAHHGNALQRLESQRVTARERAEQAVRLTSALEHRFARAKQVSRHHMAEHQGRPDATTTLFPHADNHPEAGS